MTDLSQIKFSDTESVVIMVPFFRELDQRLEGLVGDEERISGFLTYCQDVLATRPPEFSYRNSPRASWPLFAALSELEALEDQLKAWLGDEQPVDFTKMKFSDLPEELHDIFLPLDLFCAAFLRPFEYTSDLTERELELFDYRLLETPGLEIWNAEVEKRIIDDFYESPNPAFLDLELLGRRGGQSSVDLLKEVFLSGKYHQRAASCAFGLLVCFHTSTAEEILAAKESPWLNESYDADSGKYVRDLIAPLLEFFKKRRADRSPDPVSGGAIPEELYYLLESPGEDYLDFALNLLAFGRLVLPAGSHKAWRHLLTNEFVLDSLSGEDVYYICEKSAAWLVNLPDFAWRGWAASEEDFRRSYGFFTSLRQNVFQNLGPLFQYHFRRAPGPEKFTEWLEKLVADRAFEAPPAGSGLPSPETFHGFITGNFQNLLDFLALDFEGEDFRDFRLTQRASM